jgi:hypothetical protein
MLKENEDEKTEFPQTKISSQSRLLLCCSYSYERDHTHTDGMTTTTTTTTMSVSGARLSHFRRRLPNSSSSLSRRIRILQRRRIFTNTTNNELAFFVDEEEEEEEDLEEEEEDEDEEEESWIGEKGASKSTTIEPFVLGETKDILAVYKPANLGFHSEFSDGLVKKLRKMKEKTNVFTSARTSTPCTDWTNRRVELFSSRRRNLSRIVCPERLRINGLLSIT